MNKDVFITCAVTGAGGGPHKNPHVPVTPEEIATDVLAVAAAGAAIAHIHVRDPLTKEGSRDTALYAEVIERVRAKNTEVIINTTAGMGGDLVLGADDPLSPAAGTDLVPQKTRLVHVDALRPDICTLDCGSYNVGEGNLVYISTSEQIREGARLIRGYGVKPELEVFDLGHLSFVTRLISEGAFDGPVMIQFCLGVNFGAPATTAAMKTMADAVHGLDVVWSAFGVAQMQLPMVAQAALLGGNVRVGLEDNIWLARGVPATNVELVKRARTIIETMGSSVMDAAATRKKLGLS
ncbi:3-keto-5-aminohexanoate cleavage protein [Mesorhizobium shangrilense]|uniref:3-keto-5-aminohexanoate cleavage protein n=1 Tax=Mesorhizobium shangrilense TaxID=460060 RepID=A0ABV2DM02_9HYPH